jgi:hypothetical protein
MFTVISFPYISGHIACPMPGGDHMRLGGRYVKVKFTAEEDALLLELVEEHGPKDWNAISMIMQTRNARQCRERYKNYLDPSLRSDAWTPDEDALLEEKYAEFGAKWNRIARFFTNRSDNAIRNRRMMLDRHHARGTETEVLGAPQADDVVPIAPESERKAAVPEFDIFDVIRPEMAVLAEDTYDPWGFSL